MQTIVETNLIDTFVEAHIADIHFGCIDPKTEYDILNEQFLNKLEEMNVLDIVSINGDLFDHKFMANSDAVIYSIYFVQRLIEICRIKNATLILINGTESHDSNQLKLFIPYMNDTTVDVRVVTHIQFVYVKGKKILCIPEEYGKGDDYYNEYLINNGGYDACYMHGTFKGSIPMKNERNLSGNREPVFDILDFGFCKGPIISGHVHVANTYENDFYYCGSPIRYSFGEEKEKGFIILIHNIKTRQYLIHYEPIYSFRYDTVNLDNILDMDPNDIIGYINSLVNNGIYRLRVIFTKNSLEKINIIKEYYRQRPSVTIKTNFEQMKVQERLQSLNNSYSKYDYLFDQNIPYQNKFVQYVNQQENSDIWTVESFMQFMKDIEKI